MMFPTPVFVTALGEREVLSRLLQPLVRDDDALGGLAQVEQRLPHLERHVLAEGVLGRPQVVEVGLRFPTCAVVSPPLKTERLTKPPKFQLSWSG